jgi:hypothetical protein
MFCVIAYMGAAFVFGSGGIIHYYDTLRWNLHSQRRLMVFWSRVLHGRIGDGGVTT